MNTPRLILLFTLFLFSIKSQASSIAGAELTYTGLGNNQYWVTLRIANDCSGFQLSTSFTVNVSSTSCNYSFTDTLEPEPFFCGEWVFYPPCLASFTTCSGGPDFGVNQCNLSAVITLPFACADWIFSVSDTMRANSLTTIAPGQPFYLEAGLNILGQDNNSSNINSIAISACINRNETFDPGGIDADGDSLVYSFVDTKVNANTPVIYNTGYSASNPFTSLPALTLNSQTGEIGYNCPVIEVAAISLRVDEYRNGVQVGFTEKNILFYSDSCPLASPPIVIMPVQPLNIEVTEQYCFDFITYDPDQTDTILVGYNFSSMPGAVVSLTPGANPIIHFCWTPTVNDIQAQPYNFTINLQDNSCPTNLHNTFNGEIFVTPFTGISEEKKSDKIYISLDKTTGNYSVHAPVETIEEIKIFNSFGSIILTYKNINHFDLSSYSKGVYFVQIALGNGDLVLKKLVNN